MGLHYMAKKRFSIRNKLIIVFGLLIAVASLMEGTLAIRLARKAVIEKKDYRIYRYYMIQPLHIEIKSNSCRKMR